MKTCDFPCASAVLKALVPCNYKWRWQKECMKSCPNILFWLNTTLSLIKAPTDLLLTKNIHVCCLSLLSCFHLIANCLSFQNTSSNGIQSTHWCPHTTTFTWSHVMWSSDQKLSLCFSVPSRTLFNRHPHYTANMKPEWCSAIIQCQLWAVRRRNVTSSHWKCPVNGQCRFE